MESEIIRMAIARYEGHMSEVARRLGIGRSTLYRKLKEFGLEPELQNEPMAGVALDTGESVEPAARKSA
jgi:transposase-like protein